MGDYTDTLFCCGTDYTCEKQEDVEWFSFVEDLKLKKPCWKECGIVEVVLDHQGNQLFHKFIEKGLSHEKI